MSEKIERNFVIFKILFQFFFALSFPMYVLFLKDGGMNPNQIGLVNTLFMVAVCLFEVPTGIVGDRFGRKKSIIIGLGVSSLGFMWYFASTSFWMYVAAEVILALGMSFISGSLQAWLKDTLHYHNGKKSFGVVWSNGSKFAHLAGILGGSTGALLGSYCISCPWLLASLGTLFLTVLSCFIVDESYFKHTNLSWKEGAKEFSRLFKTATSLAYRQKKIRYFFAITCLTTFALQPLNQQWSLFFEATFDLKSIMFVWMGMSLALFVGSHTASRLLKKEKNQELAYLLMALLIKSSCIIVMSQQTSSILVLLLFLGHELPRGSWEPLAESYLQKQVPDEVRATMGSLSSLVNKLGAGAGWLLAGFMLEHWHILDCWLVGGLALLLTIPFFYLLLRES